MDIVEQLKGIRRNGSWSMLPCRGNEAHPVCRKAITEIEQLRAEVSEQARVNGMGGEREAALRAEIEQLRRKLAGRDAEIAAFAKALVGEREQNLWWAYQTGHEKDGKWDHMCMSDGEWLARMLGLDPLARVYDAETIKAAIPTIAQQAATAIASGSYRESGE